MSRANRAVALSALALVASLNLCAQDYRAATEDDAGATKVVQVMREELPKGLKSRVEARDVARLVAEVKGVSRKGVLAAASKLWPPGSKLRVCFLGGTPKVRKKIAHVASEWTRYGNVSFDFGQSESDGDCRVCVANDTSEVRVGFQSEGVYSFVGTDSQIVGRAGEATLNFRHFDTHLPPEPDFRYEVLHEFGHVLGFLHTHQTPGSGCRLHLYDDPGYETTWDQSRQLVPDSKGRRPGVTSMYSPEFFPDFMPFEDQGELHLVSLQHDPFSVMHYKFPAAAFEDGAKSLCYGKDRSELSRGDKISMAVLYPSRRAGDELQKALIEGFVEVLANPDTPNSVRDLIKNKLLIYAKRPGLR